MDLLRSLPAIVLALAPLMAQTTVLQPTKPEKTTETRTVPLASGSTLRVKNVNGYVRVEAWDREEVQFTGDFKPSSKDEQVKVVFEPGTRSLEIRGEYPKHHGLGSYKGPECQMTLKVPRKVLPTVENVNGEVTLSGISGPAKVETVNGAVNATNLDDSLEARTVNGTIAVNQVKGGLALKTVNGGIQAAGLDGMGKGLQASTVNGAVKLQLTGVKGRLEASTVNGGISFHTKGAEQVEVKKKRVSAVLSGGTQSISVSTVNGGVVLD